MKKTAQVAKKTKLNAVQANKKQSPAKVQPKIVKQPKNAKPAQARGGKKQLAPAKNGSKKPLKKDEEDEENDEKDVSLAHVDSEDSNDVGNDNGSGLGMDDSDSDSEDAEKVEKEDEEDEDDEEDDEDEDEDEEPEEISSKNVDEGKDGELEENDSEAEDEAEDKARVNKKESNKNVSKLSESEMEDRKLYKIRKVYVKKLNNGTSVEEITKHFESCGKIESVKIHSKGRKAEATMLFTDEAGSRAALKLNNTILNDSSVLVYHANDERHKSDPERSILVMNIDRLTKLEGEKLEKVFVKCGEIENISVVCDKNVLAYVTFKSPDSVKNAIKLNGTTQNGVQLKIQQYSGKAPKTKIFVRNIEKGVTEDALRSTFEACGPIQRISMKHNDPKPSSAIIIFENQEGYCKSFLLHEEKIRGRPIYLEPFSETPKSRKPNNDFNYKQKPFQGKRPQSGMWKKNGPPQKKIKNLA